MRSIHRGLLAAAFAGAVLTTVPGLAQSEKPNILIIWGDDIGYWNLSAYHQGMMGYETPNIDRIAEEGMLFTDAYGQQSCTAGRAAFVTGQIPYRTGLTKVGLPGSDLGLQPEDPTIAELLKEHGYATGQFGKNHLGESRRDASDEPRLRRVFGNLYHLNAEEEPEHEDYPKDPAFRERYGPRGRDQVLRRRSDRGHRSSDPQANGDRGRGDHRGALDFMERQAGSDTPVLPVVDSTRMHIYTHLRKSRRV